MGKKIGEKMESIKKEEKYKEQREESTIQCRGVDGREVSLRLHKHTDQNLWLLCNLIRYIHTSSICCYSERKSKIITGRHLHSTHELSRVS